VPLLESDAHPVEFAKSRYQEGTDHDGGGICGVLLAAIKCGIAVPTQWAGARKPQR
jgi:hypothetical protein